MILSSVHYILDDSIYLESDFVSRFKIPFLGMMTCNNSEVCKQELRDNLNYLLKEDFGYYLAFSVMGNKGAGVEKTDTQEKLLNEIKRLSDKVEGIFSLQGEDLEKLRLSNGVIIMFPWGSKNGNLLEKTLSFLEKQDITVKGVIVYDAEEKFLKKYYNTKSNR